MAPDTSDSRPSAISLFTATCIVVANMIGVGVFTSLGFQVRDVPSGFALLALWAVGGVCALCGALSYGELAAALPRSGGEYHFLSRIYHPAVGFLAGWLSATVGFAAPVAAAAMAFAKYSAHVSTPMNPTAVSLVVVLVVTGVHLGGLRAGSAFQNFATSFKVLLILALVVAGFTLPVAQPLSFAPAPGDLRLITSAPFAVSLVYVMYSYCGWNASAYVAGEVVSPSRNLPLSLFLGTAIVALLYLLLNAVFLRSAPLHELEMQLDVGHVAAAHIFGNHGGRIMAGLIAFGLLSTISAMTWIGPRVSMAMGEDCRALAFLAPRTRRGVPAVATLVQLAIVTVLILTATFNQVVSYILFSLTVCAFATVLGVLVLRHREPDLPRPYRTWGYPVTPLVFLVISLWMMVFQALDQPKASLAGLVTMALGLIIYFFSSAPAPGNGRRLRP